MAKSIYVIFSHSGTIPSKIIRKVTRKTYSHVSIATSDDITTMYSFARRYIYNPFNSGFVLESVNKGLFAKLPNIACRIYKLEVSDLEYKKVKKIINRFKRKQNLLKYNFIGLISPVLNIPFTPKDSYFCSQFVSEVLVDSGILKLDKNPVCISPGDLENYISSDVMYEGNLKTAFTKVSA
ncbi:MAG: hypothetical protein Q4D02_03345 [Clostridia bacterium]|nr:hypothetical protein [Clostridia bacterium]